MKRAREITTRILQHYFFVFLFAVIIRKLLNTIVHFLMPRETRSMAFSIISILVYYLGFLVCLFYYRKSMRSGSKSSSGKTNAIYTSIAIAAVFMTFICYFHAVYLPQQSHLTKKAKNGLYILVDRPSRSMFATEMERKRKQLFRKCKYTKPGNEPSILLVGDSFVYGSRIGVGDTLCTKIGDTLALKNITNVDIFNAAIPGIGLSSSIGLADYHISQKPVDWIVIGYSTFNSFRRLDTLKRIGLLRNDIGYQIPSAIIGIDTVSLAGQWYWNVRVRPKPMLSNKDYRMLDKMARSSRIIILSYTDPDPFLDGLTRKYPGIEVVYYNLAEKGRADPSLLVPNDDHPTGKANRIMGDMIAERIASVEKK